MNLYVLILMLISTSIYAQDVQEVDAGTKKNTMEIMEQKMKEHTEKTRTVWKYNPFRVSTAEKKLIGWLDPNSYITSFWVGDILSKEQNLIDPNWNLDNAYIFYSIKVASEVNPIAFTIDNFTFRVGVAYSADIVLLAYSGVSHLYGAGGVIISDYMRINLHFDFIWDEKLKFRWVPLFHECAHVSGDYQGDPGFDPEYKKTIPDLGIEGMMFELFYNWEFFTFYGGIQFNYNRPNDPILNWVTPYATLFGFHIGTDVRVPVWGQINFIAGIHFGLNYDLIRKLEARSDGSTFDVIEESKGWYPTIVIGTGFEFDRFTISAKYSRMRSKHIISYTTYEEKIGIDLSIFF